MPEMEDLMNFTSRNGSDGSEKQDFRFILMAHEPAGGWKNAMVEWGNGWMAFKFVLIAINVTFFIWSLSNIILMLQRRNLLSKTYFVTLNAMVLLFALTRIVFYAVDPYGVKSMVPKPIANILLNLCFPCLTVGFTMLYVGLRQFTNRYSIVNELFLKKYFIVIFAILCFLITLATDIAVAYAHSTALMILVCQIFYILWGLIFFVLFLYIACTVRRLVLSTRRKTRKMCYRRGHCIRQVPSSGLMATPAIVIVGGVAAFMFLCIATLNLYLVFAEIGLIRQTFLTDMCNKYRKIWPFFAYMCILSTCEHAMALSLLLCGSQPSKCMRLKQVKTDFTGISSTADFSSDLELDRVDPESLEEKTTASNGQCNSAFTNESETKIGTKNSAIDSTMLSSVTVASDFHLSAQVHKLANS